MEESLSIMKKPLTTPLTANRFKTLPSLIALSVMALSLSMAHGQEAPIQVGKIEPLQYPVELNVAPETVITEGIPDAEPNAIEDILQDETPAQTSPVHSDLWSRIKDGFILENLQDDLVQKHEQWYSRKPDYIARMTDRASKYLFHIVEEIQKRNMPMELALLPMIESAFNPGAVSSAKASGMWQFMPATGKSFDLKQNLFRDDRRDVMASTRAALDYLTRLYRMFGDWHLALAAYNWGEGNVQRAVQKNRRLGLPTDYLSLSMPAETRNYVPKLQAVKNIFSNPESFNLQIPKLENHPYFSTVTIKKDMDAELIIRLAGLTETEFKSLNPQHNKPVILAAVSPEILLPYDNAEYFKSNLAKHRGRLASWTAWVAPNTISLTEVAKKIGVTETVLRESNRVPKGMLVKSGSTLLVPRLTGKLDKDVAEHIADNASLTLTAPAKPLRLKTVRIGKKGETVASLAKKYKLNAVEIAKWNKVSGNYRFSSGQSVKLYFPAVNKAQAKSSNKETSAKKLAKAKPSAKKKTTVVAKKSYKVAKAAQDKNRR